MKRCFVLPLLILGSIGPARAEDPIITLQKFGLLGTWTQNCTAPITDAMLLVRFTETSLGAPRMIVSHPDDIIFETTIDAAELQPPDEIQLTIETGLAAPRQIIFRRTSDTLQLMADPPGPPLHRCISE